MTFAACLPVILENEGGLVNNPADPGGLTNLGITIATLGQYLKRTATPADVEALTPKTVAPIYEALYYAPSGADSCPEGVDLMVFDMAVNQGMVTAVRALQATIGVHVDGVAGPATRGAASSCNAVATINTLSSLRRIKYVNAGAFTTFGRGWLDRLARVTQTAIGMVHP